MDICDDAARLAALRRYGILDTPRERDFDRLVSLLAALCEAPVAVVNLIEARRQWFKAEVGLGIDETPLDVSICRHFLLRPGVTVIPDMSADSRLCGNPLIAGGPGFRFYAGCLLESAEGRHPLGTLCVLDHTARPQGLSATQRLALETLAAEVVAQMELRRALRERQAALEGQELLLKEIHHRVRNSLQIIGSVVNLQARGTTDAAALAALRDTGARIRAVAAVHARLHRADRLDAVEMDRFLPELVDGLREAAPAGIALVLRAVEPVALPLGHAVATGLLVNELVTNALKYAYPVGQRGRVEVALERDGSAAGGGRGAPGARLLLTVRDHGRGLPPDMAAAEPADGGPPRRPGGARASSLGMRLIGALSRQLGGAITFADAAPGTLARLAFPQPPATAIDGLTASPTAAVAHGGQ